MSPARVRSAPGDFHPSAIAHADDQLGLEPVRLADQLSLVEVETSKEIIEPTDNSFDPAIWAIAAALCGGLVYLVLLG
jgi:hypothetical protein